MSKIQELFGIDLRSLALFRIGLALLILADLINRGRSLRAHYTDLGVLPRAVWIEKFAEPWEWSLHLLNGSFAFQFALFLLAGAFAISLLLGYRSKWALGASWVLLISLQTRNVMVLQAGDVIFRLLLFWALFLPIGARFSVDRLLSSAPPSPQKTIVSVATLGILLQLCFVYWFSVAHRWHQPVWWDEHTAVYYALSIDQFSTRFGQFLLGFPALLKPLTYVTIRFEMLGPLLAFLPWVTGPVRCGIALSFMLMHLGFSLGLEVGLFSYVMLVGWILFLPSWFWERLTRRLQAWKSTATFGRSLRDWGVRWRDTIIPVRPAGVRPHRRSLSWLSNLVAAVVLCYIVLWNLRTLDFEKYEVFFPRDLNWFGMVLRLDQQWNMFAPPLKDDGWYVIPGHLKNGKQIDVYRKGEPVTWQKPELVSTTYPSQRWRKYMMNIWLSRYTQHRLYYGRYLCQDWNHRHQGDEQLDRFEIFFVREDTLPYPETSSPQKVSTWRHYCFKVPDSP